MTDALMFACGVAMLLRCLTQDSFFISLLREGIAESVGLHTLVHSTSGPDILDLLEFGSSKRQAAYRTQVTHTVQTSHAPPTPRTR